MTITLMFHVLFRLRGKSAIIRTVKKTSRKRKEATLDFNDNYDADEIIASFFYNAPHEILLFLDP